MTRLIVSALVALSVLGLSACNTMQGLGQDIEKAGSAISGAAK
ncbi:MAG: entericidin A/B family lipoprotein [Aquabacterium sp.]|jgi:predicted small secreted protein|nr:entericidin A/B family lipoprotein [Aquabacterium sp.]MBP7131448.1 entericidin A/B family lipoprotein [Aquabacterium sp.]MBP9064312.1 entericidin A/B family lipoprotein [Aquabacterium sp.]MDQ5925652.1 Entericidin [Pseudomonadota bacterium]